MNRCKGKIRTGAQCNKAAGDNGFCQWHGPGAKRRTRARTPEPSTAFAESLAGVVRQIVRSEIRALLDGIAR